MRPALVDFLSYLSAQENRAVSINKGDEWPVDNSLMIECTELGLIEHSADRLVELVKLTAKGCRTIGIEAPRTRDKRFSDFSKKIFLPKTAFSTTGAMRDSSERRSRSKVEAQKRSAERRKPLTQP
jgi:hypothetical protein